MPVVLDSAEKEILNTYVMEVWGRGRVELVDDLVAPDVIDHDPFPGQAAGREGWKQAIRMVREAIPDLGNTILDMVQQDALIAVRFISSGHLTGPFLDRPADGGPVLIRALELQRVSDGRMRETHRLLDIRFGHSGPATWDVASTAR